MSVRITYYGHSCFTLESGGYVLAIDPYDENVPGYGPLKLKAGTVWCSHGHGDHCAIDRVELLPGGESDPFDVVEIETYHDDQEGELRGMNMVRVFEAEGLRIAHMGDLGCALEPEEKAELSDLDVMMIPVGGHFTIDAVQAKAIIDELKPRLVIPMHYRSGDKGYDVIADIGDFLRLCPDAKVADGSSLVLRKGEPEGIIVLGSM